MSLNFPDFESMLAEALNIRVTRVATKAIKVTESTVLPNARVVRKTLVVSIIEKTGRTSNIFPGKAI